jgi:hypothetical protein
VAIAWSKVRRVGVPLRIGDRVAISIAYDSGKLRGFVQGASKVKVSSAPSPRCGPHTY